MQISHWNRTQKIEFYREYLDAVFPVLEGDRPPEVVIPACRRFLSRHAGIDLSSDLGGEAECASEAGRTRDDRIKLGCFVLECLQKKLASRLDR